ncbi:hypothetical protein AQUCO_00500373v1 [Aquilegia coerulea]|uniref:HMA domain-containing protein n=1 Tax=Aquilegia coerulea TaxID=218851 RepID=A0A2G5ERN5_AQUCA|nr:hypothetical protein AQUCO_00500373v1 [Aquilegia coerulea]
MNGHFNFLVLKTCIYYIIFFISSSVVLSLLLIFHSLGFGEQAMAEKISAIVIKVDLGCEKCYNKIRQILCKYHCQIQSKTFDMKNNIVIVTGWFDPCNFAKKLRCKAGKAIKSIEIVKKKEPEPEKPPSDPPAPEPKKPTSEPEKPPPEPEKQPDPPAQAPEPTPEPPKKDPEPEPPVKILVPYFVPGYPPWHEGYGGAPCYEGYGMPARPVSPPYHVPAPPPCHVPPPCYVPPQPPVYVPPQPPVYDCYYGGPPPCSCGCGGYRRCATPGEYFTEENPSTCSIM